MHNPKKLVISVCVCILLACIPSVMALAATQTGYTKGAVLNLRKAPDTSSTILDQLEEGTKVAILSSGNGWYKVTYRGITGYLSAQYVSADSNQSPAVVSSAKPGETPVNSTGYITGSVVNVRSSPSTSSEVVLKLKEGASVAVAALSGDWYRIKTSGGTQGWVSREYLSIRGANSSRGDEEELTAAQLEAAKNEKNGDSTAEQKMVSYAKKFIGVKYVWGGNTPSSGFDCSGFVKYVYKNFGVNLNRVASDQAAQGLKVAKDKLKPGDLVFFDTNGGHNSINHVGMYIGGGQFIHASSSRSVHRVTISSLSGGYYSNAYMTARRFID